MIDMSNNAWQNPSENENKGRSSRENREPNRYEGLEGMNYEQKRQPFKPEHANKSSNKNKSSGEEGKAPNDA
jgi:hypothetical protein